MPTYEYECPKCGTHFDEFQKMSAKPVAKCPKCGSKAKRQMSAGAGLVFKGSGFYLTDYGRAGQKPRSADAESSGDEMAESKPEKADAKPEAAGPAKPDSRSESKAESKSESKSEFKPSKVKKKKAD